MENKTNKIVVIIFLTVFSLLFVGLLIYGIVMSNKEENKPVTTTTSTTTRTSRYSSYDDEIATFHGGSGEVTYETVIYKVPNGQYNMGFKYENKTCTTKSWGSTEWDCRTTKTGEVTWTDDVFTVAQNNGAYSYVTRPNDSKTYSINEFAEIFIMD
jgi:hypothetical protein